MFQLLGMPLETLMDASLRSESLPVPFGSFRGRGEKLKEPAKVKLAAAKESSVSHRQIPRRAGHSWRSSTTHMVEPEEVFAF